MTKDFLSYRKTVLVITEFLEVAFHTILYLRHVYPSQLFHQRKKYEVPVWQSRHPSLNDYLGRVVEAIGEELGKGTLRRVALVVKEATLEETPLERFVFDLDWLVPADQIPPAGENWTPAAEGLEDCLIEDHLRGFLVKLNAADSYLLSNPPDVTFTIIIELKSDAPPPESIKAKKQIVPAEWIPAEERLAPGGKDDGRSSITPLKSTALGIVNLQMAVEELEPKFGFEDARRKDRLEQESSRGIGEDRKGKGKAV